MSVVFSGMQPSGDIHLGNYLAMVEPLLAFKEDKKNKIISSIVDLHSITLPIEPQQLYTNSLNLAAFLIASGLNEGNSLVFLQSSIKEHSELAWLLSCTAKIGWLNRMIQFKEKTGSNKERASCGLYFYPLLMAADILLYNSDIVPVGEDQKQHLEFTRDIAMAFNRYYDTNFFNIPAPYILQGARIMSLKDGTKKMSKSDASDYAKILLSDTNDIIAKKIKKAKTDSLPIEEDITEMKKRPEAYNLLNIYSLVNKTSINETLTKFKGSGFALVKQELIDVLIKLINPLRMRYNELLKDKNFLIKTLQSNAENIREIAHNNLLNVKKIIGFISNNP